MKKEKVVIVLLCLFIIFNILSVLLTANFFYRAKEYYSVTGESVTASINLIIEEWRKIEILSPQNTTYIFGGAENYTLDLNVSANFNANSWWFDLIDLKHNITINKTAFFTPNTTFNAERWSNRLDVYAIRSTGDIYRANVTFFVDVSATAPVIEYIAPEIYVCEGSYLSYYFNVTDLDEDIITSSITPSIPFYVAKVSQLNLTKSRHEIFSGTLNKDHLGGINVGSKIYQENVSVSDGIYADSKKINITVIEINNFPSIQNIGVQTIWGHGDNRTFYYEVNVTDTEEGNKDSANFTFNITILNSTGNVVNLFNISENGTINYTAENNSLGVYNISVFVTDNGLNNPHRNISLCGDDGTGKTSNKSFSLTITDENRPPYITSYYPLNLTLYVYEGEFLYFNITMRDPDLTPLDSYWYVDRNLTEYSNGAEKGGGFDDFSYIFSYDSAGEHEILVKVTDGILNQSYDYIAWNLTVLDAVPPPPTPPSGGGGGGGGGAAPSKVCIEKWGCGEWGSCQNAKNALETGIISEEQYKETKEVCNEKGWDANTCGYYIRSCYDTNVCNKTDNKPLEFQGCYYTKKATCGDGIKNCHDDSCEILTDCGGPCPACPTCSDGIRNQGEGDVDCGGPCPWPCVTERPAREVYFRYLLIIIIIILVIIAIVVLIKKSRNKIVAVQQ